MPRKDTSRYKLAFGWLRGEDFWGDPTSDNTDLLDTLVHPYALSMTQVNPPTGYTLGDSYIVPPGAAGAWAGHEYDLAKITSAGWRFASPTIGVRCRLASPQGWYWFAGDEIGWIPESENPGEPAPTTGTRFDVNTSVGFESEPRDKILVLPIPEPMRLPVGGTGSRATCDSNPPDAQVIITILRNGVPVGTITFSPGNMTGVVTIPMDTIFATGDRLALQMPDSLVPNFRDFGILLRFLLIE